VVPILSNAPAQTRGRPSKASLPAPLAVVVAPTSTKNKVGRPSLASLRGRGGGRSNIGNRNRDSLQTATSSSSTSVNLIANNNSKAYELFNQPNSSHNRGFVEEKSSSGDMTSAEIKYIEFQSCLADFDVEVDMQNDSSPKGVRPILLRRALSIRELDDESWLSSSLIDLVISKFSKTYKGTHFMSIDFVVLSLSSLNRMDLEQATDISGKKVDYSNPKTPIVFVCNSNKIHWNLIRVIRYPKPELQLFEPMGKPENRHGGLGFRDVPRCVIQWLDVCAPISNNVSWLSLGMSAITTQQQFTPFDCGVACLLYAEKCGQGQNAAQINAYTTQENITEYRGILQAFTKKVTAMDDI
jgi:hypothetical protein